MVAFVSDWPALVSVLLVVAVAWVLTRIVSWVTRRSFRRVAAKSLDGSGSWWQTRARRDHDISDSLFEQRRMQRIDAAAAMLSHLFNVAVWLAATIAVFHLLDVNAAFYLSSAGFLGAAIAIGGQHKVNDYLTGLSVHFEDRYGVGDTVVMSLGSDAEVEAVVDHVGLFTTRLRDVSSTLHVPNGAMAQVRNLSQEPPPTVLKIRVSDDVAVVDVVDAVRDVTADRVGGVVVVGDVMSTDAHTGEVEVTVATLRPLSDAKRDRIVVSVTDRLSDR